MHSTVLLLFFASKLCIGFQEFQNPHFFKNNSVIVNLMDWKWLDIADECERFLGSVGFGGIQVSPITENIILMPNRSWVERYQPVSYQIISRSGNESEFKDMVKRCNKVGVRIYVDTITNQMAPTVPDQPTVIGEGGSTAVPSNRSYPYVPYARDDFHKYCKLEDVNDLIQMRECDMPPGLPDLNQSTEHVREMITNFMNLCIEYGVAGFRMDATKRMWPRDLNIIYNRLYNLSLEAGFANGSRPYIYQEIIDLSDDGFWKNQYTFAVVTEFKLGIDIAAAIIGNGSLSDFGNSVQTETLVPSDNAVVFIDNHDSQRGQLGNETVLTYKQPRAYRMAVGFLLAYTYGNPTIMSSFAFDTRMQGPPQDTDGSLLSPVINPEGYCRPEFICEHRWHQIYNMVMFRNIVSGTNITKWWDNGYNQVAFSRGDAGFIAFNSDVYDFYQNISTTLSPGEYCDIISGDLVNNSCTGKTININNDGYAYVEILLNATDGFIAIHKNAKVIV